MSEPERRFALGEPCPLCGRSEATMTEVSEALGDIRKAAIKNAVVFPSEGFGCATLVMPLPSNHWLRAEGENEPPAPWRIGLGPKRDAFASQLRTIARYAIRTSTLNGKEIDFDPDAMVQNFVVGALGYWTVDGGSSCDFAAAHAASEEER